MLRQPYQPGLKQEMGWEGDTQGLMGTEQEPVIYRRSSHYLTQSPVPGVNTHMHTTGKPTTTQRRMTQRQTDNLKIREAYMDADRQTGRRAGRQAGGQVGCAQAPNVPEQLEILLLH